MTYDDIFSRSYMKKYDPNFYDDEQFAYETMVEWMKDIAAMPYVKIIFSNITFDDEIATLSYTLKNSVSEEADDNFVTKLFTDGFVICWMRPKVDSILNLSLMIGSSDEKKIKDDYKANADRLEFLERKLKKYVRDYTYTQALNS